MALFVADDVVAVAVLGRLVLRADPMHGEEVRDVPPCFFAEDVPIQPC